MQKEGSSGCKEQLQVLVQQRNLWQCAKEQLSQEGCLCQEVHTIQLWLQVQWLLLELLVQSLLLELLVQAQVLELLVQALVLKELLEQSLLVPWVAVEAAAVQVQPWQLAQRLQ